MYKDLGNFIFQETYNMMRNPTSLIIKLKGVGSWHLRKKRMEIVVNEWADRGRIATREEFESDAGWESYQERHKQYNIFKARLEDYDKYLSLKREINAKRRETQVLLRPAEGEDERFKSS